MTMKTTQVDTEYLLCVGNSSKLSVVYIPMLVLTASLSVGTVTDLISEDTEEHRDEVTCPVCGQDRMDSTLGSAAPDPEPTIT